MTLDQDRCYRAVSGRDARFDGVFFTAVRTTGIYCRPSCAARTPKRENVSFFPSAAAAQDAGYRACRRCRPDATPGSPQWDVRSDTVARAMRLLRDGVVEEEGVVGLASRLGYSERHVHRMLVAELGAGPLALARSARAHHARVLLETTPMPVTEVAFAAGFASVRQFNDTIRASYDSSPRELRASAVRRSGPTGAQSTGRITLRLALRTPFASGPLLDWLATRAVPGVEAVIDGTYARTIQLAHGPATVALTMRRDHVECRLETSDPADVRVAVSRCRALLDLDADPEAVDDALGQGVLADSVRATPGLRVPGHVDGYELAVRAVIGQQVSVAGARTTCTRIVEMFGRTLADDPTSLACAYGLTRTFPAPQTLADADPSALGVPRARGETVLSIASAVANDKLEITGGADRSALRADLLAIRGIGPWTADYILMRGARDPDVLLGTDLVVHRALAAHDLGPETTDRWRPWRSYAAMHLLRLPDPRSKENAR